jgi:hypothetical protein
MSAAGLRYPPGDNGHRPFPSDMLTPGICEPFVLNGKGWASPELSALCRDFGHAQVRSACAALDLDPRRQNVAALRAHLEAQEARLK